MTESSEVLSNSSPSGENKLDKYARLKIAFGLKADPHGRPAFIWAERWNAPILALLIAVGIPLLGWSGLTNETKWIIAFYWAAFFILYMLLEGREIMGQMEGRGTISAPQARTQVRTAQLPHIGTLLAVVAWVVAKAYYRGEPGGSPIVFGWVEWNLVAFNAFGVFIANYVFNGLLMELLKSAPRGERSEMRLPRGG